MSTQYLLGCELDKQQQRNTITRVKQRVRFAEAIEVNEEKGISMAEDTLSNEESSSAVTTRSRNAPKKMPIPLYRRYRSGDIPDISISLADILKPIQGLCLKDRRVASKMIECIFTSVYHSRPGITHKLCFALLQMIQQSCEISIDNTDFVSTLFSVALVCIPNMNDATTGFTINPGHVSSMALTSLNYYAGIRLLEQILFEKRLKNVGEDIVSDIEDNAVWVELNRLYGALKENDILLGISTKILQGH